MTERTKPLSLREYANMVGIHQRTAWNHLKAGKIPGAVRVGNIWRIPLSSVPESLRPEPQQTETMMQRRKRHLKAMEILRNAK